MSFSAVVRSRGDDKSIVKFYGRNTDIDKTGPQFTSAVERLVSVINGCAEMSRNDALWKSLETETSALLNTLLNSEYAVKKYQLDLVAEGLIPYLEKMGKRRFLDKQRFMQINKIVTALLSAETHPAVVLQTIDEVAYEISSNRSYMWKSELQTILETASAKQWQPIISDTRQMLQSAGGKFMLLGLVGIFGWPMALLYPLFKMTTTLLRIANEWETKKRLTPQSMFELAQTLMLLFVSMQLLSILQLYSSMGYFSFACGSAALFVSANNQLIKLVAPAIAPHAAQIDAVVQQLSSLDSNKLQSLVRGVVYPVGRVQEPTAEPVTSDRVEIIGEDEDIPVAEATQLDVPFLESTGLRQRSAVRSG